MPEAAPTILAIDDSQITLTLIDNYLSELDVHTITASGADEGLALARARQPDPVLCDTLAPSSIFLVIREILVSIVGTQAFTVYVRER